MIHVTEEQVRKALRVAFPGVPEGVLKQRAEIVARQLQAAHTGRAGLTDEDLRQMVSEHEETLQFVLGELDGLEGRLEALEGRLGERPEVYRTPTWMDVDGPRPPSYEEFMGHVTERLSEIAKRINELRSLV